MRFIFYILFISVFIFSSCSTSKEVTFKEMANVQLKSIEKNGTIKVTADAVMNNPRRVGAKVTYMECEVFIDGKPIANVAQLRETKVPRRSDFSIPLETSISLKDIMENAFSITKSIMSDGKVDMKLNGTVKVKVLGKTFTIPFDFEDETPVL